MNILAVFRSRTQTMEFYSEMKKSGAPVQITSTPSKAKVGCGLSCRFPQSFLIRARALSKRYASFSGFYKIISSGAVNDYVRI